MTLHDRIMNINSKLLGQSGDYGSGFRSGILSASRVAKEADELMAEMADSLDFYASDDDVFDVAKSAMDKYKAWKEPAK